MNNKIYLVLIAAITIIIINIGSTALHNIDCKYSNYNGSFTFEEMNSKERNFDMATYKFMEFKKLKQGDTVLYRLCKINLLEFWNWGSYLFEEKFRLPYTSWSEIEARRGPVTLRSGFQDF